MKHQISRVAQHDDDPPQLDPILSSINDIPDFMSSLPEHFCNNIIPASLNYSSYPLNFTTECLSFSNAFPTKYLDFFEKPTKRRLWKHLPKQKQGSCSQATISSITVDPVCNLLQVNCH